MREGARDRVWRLRSPEGGGDRRQGEGGFRACLPISPTGKEIESSSWEPISHRNGERESGNERRWGEVEIRCSDRPSTKVQAIKGTGQDKRGKSGVALKKVGPGVF